MIYEQDNKDRYFKGQMSDEIFMLFFRKHWFYLIPNLLVFFLVCVAAIVFTVFLIKMNIGQYNTVFYHLLIVLALAGFCVYFHWIHMKLFSYFQTICVLSDRRIIALSKSVFAMDSKETVDLGMIQDIRKEQKGLLRNLLNYGDIVITLSSSSAVARLHEVPNVEFHFRAISRAKEAHHVREHQALGPHEAHVSAPIEQLD